MLSPEAVDLDFQRLWYICKRRWLSATLIFGGTMVIALGLTTLLKPAYEAQGKLLIKKSSQTSALTGLGGEKLGQLEGLDMKSSPISTEMKVVHSIPLLQKTLAILNLKDQKGVPIKLEQEQRELERQLEAAQSTYQTLLKKLQEVKVQENQNIGNARIIEPALVTIKSTQSIENPMFLYWQLRNAGIILHVLPIELQAIEQKLELNMLGGIPVLNFVPPIITGSDFWVKRCFDFCSAAAAIILASPLYLCIALLIKLDSPGPIFYKQTRIGLHGHPFKVWKFRTMVMNADKLQKELEARNEMQDGVLFKMKNDPRITTLGKFLRRYSLDEIPQLFNVLFGEMSLVGPRPLPIRDVEKFSKHHFIRHEILPGITGLWQVSGRSDIVDFEKVIRLDVTYMENWSLSLDLQILLQTFRVILEKKGAY